MFSSEKTYLDYYIFQKLVIHIFWSPYLQINKALIYKIKIPLKIIIFQKSNHSIKTNIFFVNLIN